MESSADNSSEFGLTTLERIEVSRKDIKRLEESGKALFAFLLKTVTKLITKGQKIQSFLPEEIQKEAEKSESSPASNEIPMKKEEEEEQNPDKFSFYPESKLFELFKKVGNIIKISKGIKKELQKSNKNRERKFDHSNFKLDEEKQIYAFDFYDKNLRKMVTQYNEILDTAVETNQKLYYLNRSLQYEKEVLEKLKQYLEEAKERAKLPPTLETIEYYLDEFGKIDLARQKRLELCKKEMEEYEKEFFAIPKKSSKL